MACAAIRSPVALSEEVMPQNTRRYLQGILGIALYLLLT